MINTFTKHLLELNKTIPAPVLNSTNTFIEYRGKQAQWPYSGYKITFIQRTHSFILTSTVVMCYTGLVPR
jgi:hypothetical protein